MLCYKSHVYANTEYHCILYTHTHARMCWLLAAYEAAQRIHISRLKRRAMKTAHTIIWLTWNKFTDCVRSVSWLLLLLVLLLLFSSLSLSFQSISCWCVYIMYIFISSFGSYENENDDNNNNNSIDDDDERTKDTQIHSFL